MIQKLILSYENYWRTILKVTADHEHEIKEFYSELVDDFTIREKVVYRSRGRLRKKVVYWDPLSLSPPFEEDGLVSAKIKIQRGLTEYLLLRLYESEFYYSILEEDLDDPPRIELIDKWVDILGNYKDGDQLKAVQKLLNHPNGLAALYTGYGKTELLLAVIESYLEANPDKESLILVPSNAIRDEIGLRMKKWDFQYSDRVLILVPQGYARTKDTETIDERLRRIELAVTDEVHHISATTWEALIMENLPNLRYSYGFSATPDPKSGIFPTITTEFSSMSKELVKVVSLTGIVRVRRKPHKKKLTIVKLLASIAEDIDFDTMSYPELIDASMAHEKFVEIIAQVLRDDPDLKLYIPSHKIVTGKFMVSSLREKGIPAVHWSADGFDPPIVQSLEELKEAVEKGLIRVLVSTSVAYEGVDLPALNGVILAHGKNWRMTLQPVGRSARGEAVKVFLLYDNKNPVTLSQSKKRRSILKDEYQVEEDISIDFRNVLEE